MPVIAVIEEAQSVLSNTSASPEDPYVVWTKEGRKYDLGSVLVTQQPGSIDAELLSQGDNWFIFHLLSAQDLLSVKRANSHFSDDLLTSLLNEPIRGNGVFWSSAWERSYPIPFAPCCSSGPTRREIPGTTNPPRRHTRRCCESRQLTWWLPAWLRSRRAVVMSPTPSRTPGDDSQTTAEGVDAFATFSKAAVDAAAKDSALLARLSSDQGAPWMAVESAIRDRLPADLADRDTLARSLVPRLLDEVFGTGRWRRERRPKRDDPSREVTWVIATGPRTFRSMTR